MSSSNSHIFNDMSYRQIEDISDIEENLEIAGILRQVFNGVFLIFFVAAVILGSFGAAAYAKTESSDFGGSSIEIISGVSTSIQAFISDATLVVTACTNQSISTTNTSVTGKVILANGCPVITDRSCVEYVCTVAGVCEEITSPGGECSLSEQCVESLGSNYGCDTDTCLCVQLVPTNGSASTDGLSCVNGTITSSGSTCPTAGQVLTAVDNQTAEWDSSSILLGVDVFINESISVGYLLVVVVENETATWNDDTIATLDATQTLSDKTLTAPIISTISNDGVITLPNTTGTLLIEENANGTATFSGIWATPLTATFRLSKIGHQVTMWLEAMGVATTNAAAVIVSDAFVPVAFRPFAPFSIIREYAMVVKNNVTIWVSGYVGDDGTISFSGSVTTGGTFPSGAPCGVDQDQILTWYT